MPALITGRNKKGRHRTCNADCYTATKPRCRCVCGGKNHGVGLHQAKVQTNELYDDYLAGKPMDPQLQDSTHLKILGHTMTGAQKMLPLRP